MHLHLVEVDVRLLSVGQRALVIEHEPITVSVALEYLDRTTYWTLSWTLPRISSASGKMERTGQRPICRRIFLLSTC